MLGVVRCVCVMTRPACTSLYLFINMHKMQVLVSVPETCQCGRLCIKHQGLLMTIEAEVIILRIERSIKDRREILPQYPVIVRAVGIMAARAITLFYRPVIDLILRKEILHLNDIAVTHLIGLVMTNHAAFNRLPDQLLDEIRNVRVMTGKTFLVCV